MTERNVFYLCENFASGVIKDSEIRQLDTGEFLRYPGQQIHMIVIEDYVYLVPFIESEEDVFLKTIIPSRKATKAYRGAEK